MIRWWFFPSLLLFVFGSCPTPDGQEARQVLRSSLQPPVAITAVADPPTKPFPYGVASGDPLPNAVILWSMLDTVAARIDSLITWQISRQADFASVLKSDTLFASAKRRFSIKVDATRLSPNTTYYYRFRNHGSWSATGRTRTAPTAGSSPEVRLAIVSCNALEWGYMNAFGRIAEQLELNAVVHLGDYIYEYASGVYGDTTLGRLHEPRHEVITADDYHIRYAQYRRDPQLLAAHAVHPFICIWDDHEVANDSYTTGAENHDALTEGSYLTRMTSAKEIYYNWMPIREQANGAIYRSLSFGQTADLHMLDERLAGRDQPATSFSPTELGDTTRRMLGEEQFGWLCSELRYSTARWQLIGNQVLFSELDLSDILPQYAVNLDAWDGYAYEQQRLKDSLAHYENSNTIFLTGDTHCSWYFDVNDQHGERLAHELATPSVSSANYDEFIIGWDTLTVARYRLYRNNDHLHYTNIKDHGYLYLQLDSASAQAEFHYSESIRYPTQKEQAITTFNLTYVDHTPAR
jgi:alkaline phosphatase D